MARSIVLDLKKKELRMRDEVLERLKQERLKLKARMLTRTERRM